MKKSQLNNHDMNRMNPEELRKREKDELIGLILRQRKELKFLNKHKTLISQLNISNEYWHKKYLEQLKKHSDSIEIYEEIVDTQRHTILCLQGVKVRE